MVLALGEGEDLGNVVEALEAWLAKWQGLGPERLAGFGGLRGPAHPRSQERVDLFLESGAVLAPPLLQRGGYIRVQG